MINVVESQLNAPVMGDLPEVVPFTISRRDLLKDAAIFSGMALAETAFRYLGVMDGEAPPTSASLAETYKMETEKLSEFAAWASMVTQITPDGSRETQIEDDADAPRRAGSVNKLATALAILDTRDIGLLDLRQNVAVPDYAPDPGAKSKLNNVETVDSLLTKMIIDSSNEAFRALITTVSGEDINKILWEKGLRHTFLQESELPGRFFTGFTTARDTHNLLLGLVNGGLLSPSSSRHLLNLMLHSTFNLGIKRNINDSQRQSIASKYGQLEDCTNEVGIIFADGPNGKVPHTIFSFFATALGSAPHLPSVEQAFYEFTRLKALAVHATLGAIMSQSCVRSLNGGCKTGLNLMQVAA